jgi:hypothetical protein
MIILLACLFERISQVNYLLMESQWLSYQRAYVCVFDFKCFNVSGTKRKSASKGTDFSSSDSFFADL